MLYKNKSISLVAVSLFLLTMFCSAPPPSFARISTGAEVKTSGEADALRVAPGELLPVSVKLLNFGGGEKVDVTITYKVKDAENNVLVTETETVAVETTASFIKNIQIPRSISPGEYIAESSIVYVDQEVPATSNFQFTVEKKIGNIFLGDFILYSIVTFLVGCVFVAISRFLIKKKHSRVVLHDYSDIPKSNRMYYEMISDVIMQMHRSEGDRAYDMAAKIQGLTINPENGKVLWIKNDPAEIITLLLIKYQTEFGVRSDISPHARNEEKDSELEHLDKNVDIINTYFSKK